MIKKIVSALSIVAVIFGSIGFNPMTATAAQMTGVKDTLSTVATSATATHVITATLVGANTFAAGDSIVYDFTDADFTLNAIGNWQVGDFSFSDSTGSRTILAVSTSSGVAPTCTTSGNNVCVTINTTTNTFTVFPTSGGSFTASSAASPTTFTINGTTASGTGTMTNKTSDVDNSVFTITETSDSATGAVVAETNGVVTVTATVSPTLTFSNSQAAVDFGPLTSGAARYATGGAASGGSATNTTTAHTLTVGTNAASGYSVTYNSAATLTSGVNTIAAATNIALGGTPGSAQFALGVVTSTGSPTLANGYDIVGASHLSFATGTPTQIFSASAPASSDAVNVRYLANIPASQPAGSYSTTLTYVATGNF